MSSKKLKLRSKDECLATVDKIFHIYTLMPKDEAEKLLSFGAQSPQYDHLGRRIREEYSPYSQNLEIHRRMLQANTVNPPKALGDFIIAEILSIQQSYNAVSDGRLLGFVNVNNFLAQKEFENYGDYLEANWDRDYKQLLTLSIPIYPHTESLVEKFYYAKSLFSHHLAKSIRARVAELSKSEFETILKAKKILLQTPSTSVILRIDSILSEAQAPTRMKTKKDVENTLYQLFGRTLSKETSFNIRAKFEAFPSVMRDFLQSITDNETMISNSVVSTNQFASILKALEDNIDELSMNQYFAVLFSLNYRSCVVSSGNKADYVKFLAHVLDSCDDDEKVSFFKLISNIVFLSNTSAPTIADWYATWDGGYLRGIESEVLSKAFFTEELVDEKKKHNHVVFRGVFQ